MKLKIRMPENKETKAEYPYASSYGNRIRRRSFQKIKPNNLTDMESGKNLFLIQKNNNIY